jgi:hypothetical protein
MAILLLPDPSMANVIFGFASFQSASVVKIMVCGFYHFDHAQPSRSGGWQSLFMVKFSAIAIV